MSFIRYFIAVPRIVLKDNRYSSTDKLVLGMINSLSNNKGYCYAKNSMLATELNVGTKTISNSLSKLKKNNVIIIEYLEYQRRIYLNPEIVNQENAKVKEKKFQNSMEEKFQYKRKEYIFNFFNSKRWRRQYCKRARIRSRRLYYKTIFNKRIDGKNK